MRAVAGVIVVVGETTEAADGGGVEPVEEVVAVGLVPRGVELVLDEIDVFGLFEVVVEIENLGPRDWPQANQVRLPGGGIARSKWCTESGEMVVNWLTRRSEAG